MQRVVKVAASSGLWLRRAGDVQRSATAMSTAVKVDGGKNSSGIDPDAPGVSPAERQAFRDDMAKSYGGAYSERSADEGYGERYGETVKITKEEKSTTELQRGETAERDQKADAVVDVEYDMTQGEHVAEKEVSRHSKK